MIDVFTLRSDGAVQPVPPAGKTRTFSPPDMFAMIESTAETMRLLLEDIELVEAREKACRLQLERDREAAQVDLQELWRTVESCLERVTETEAQLAAAKTHARLAAKLCKEMQIRQAAAERRAERAETRAEIAEERLALFRNSLPKEFIDLFEIRAP